MGGVCTLQRPHLAFRGTTTPLLDDGASIGQARFDVVERQVREGGEQVVEVGIVSQVLQDTLDRNSGPSHDGLANHDPGILRDALEKIRLHSRHAEASTGAIIPRVERICD
jgi:hypothetical protein